MLLGNNNNALSSYFVSRAVLRPCDVLGEMVLYTDITISTRTTDTTFRILLGEAQNFQLN